MSYSQSKIFDELGAIKKQDIFPAQAQHAVTFFLAMQPGREGVFTRQINQQNSTTDSKEKTTPKGLDTRKTSLLQPDLASSSPHSPVDVQSSLPNEGEVVDNSGL